MGGHTPQQNLVSAMVWADFTRALRRLCLVYPKKNQLLSSGVRGELASWSRLTCSTVGIRIPGFLVEHQGTLWSDHPHKCWNFAVRKEILDIFSTAHQFFVVLQDDFNDYHNQSQLPLRLINLCSRPLLTVFFSIPK